MWEAWERIISYGFDRVGIQKSGKKNWTHVNGDQQQMIVQVIKMEQHGFIVHQTPNTDIVIFFTVCPFLHQNSKNDFF